MMMKSVWVVLMVVMVSGLHLPSHRGQFSRSNYVITDIHIVHMQQANNDTLIQSHLNMLQNQLSMLQHSYLQISKLGEIQVINNQGTIIKCKNISQLDQANLNYAFQHFNTDMWQTYFELQRFIDQGGQNDLFEKQYQQIKQKKLILQNKSFTFCPHTKSVSTTTTEIKKQQNSFADISDNKLISNLDANQNWTYGKISKQQYQLNQFQFVMTNDVIQCPDDTPFASNGKCINCNDSEIFFLDNSICSPCPAETVSDNKSHMCINKSNLNCTGNQIFNPDSKKCECPSGSPYFNGVECIGCFIPKYWNNQTKICESCTSGQYYSITNGSCLSCSDQKNFVSSLSSCHDQCTLSKPDYDGQKCMKCPEIFNPQTKKCESCQKGYYFNQDKRICQQIEIKAYPSVNCSKGYIFNPENGQCIKEPVCYCPSNYVYNANTTKCQCPQNLPYDTGVKCINCQAPSTWDSVSKQCIEESFIDTKPIDKVIDKVPVINVQNATENITEQTTENITKQTTKNATKQTTKNATKQTTKNATKQTTENATKQTTENITIQQCGKGQIWNNDSKTCNCMTQTPYRTLGGQCIKCLPPNKWSQTLRQCLPPAPTCKSNYIFDPSTQKCICPKDKPFSNGKECKSCYLPMYWSNTQKKCKYCPTKQYFNPMTRSCEFCPQERPILVSHVCQGCQQGTHYNKQNYRCESIICYDGAVFSQQINDCYCLDRLKPFYNGQQCVSCMPPNRWDIASRSCVYDKAAYKPYTAPTQN